VIAPLSIGPVVVDPPVLLAPMAGFTNYAFRAIVRRLGGCGLPVTEMVSARGFHEMDRRRGAVPERLWGVRDEPRPLAVQIWDNDPGVLAEIGARLAAEYRASVIDINFGCPAADVSGKAQCGAFLLDFPERIGQIVARVAAACAPVPVTAKIRLGTTRDRVRAVEVAQAVEAAGGAAVAIHGRTAADQYRGAADWEQIAAVKPHLRRIPLIGNGDLRTAAEAAAAFTRYGVDGVMIGRAALQRPWLFREVCAALRGEPIPPEPSPAEQRELVVAHYRLLAKQLGPQGAVVQMRSAACGYVAGRPGARAFRNAVCQARSAADLLALIEAFYVSDAPGR
jgi:tRNA-dihydrouridine synthase B